MAAAFSVASVASPSTNSRSKAHVVLQSCSARQPAQRTMRHLRALMVGHLRDEKDPRTYWRAAQRLRWSQPAWLWRIAPYAIGGLAGFWLVERIAAF